MLSVSFESEAKPFITISSFPLKAESLGSKSVALVVAMLEESFTCLIRKNSAFHKLRVILLIG